MMARPPRRVTIVRRHGWWVAEVEGESLAVLHSTFASGAPDITDYFAPIGRAHDRNQPTKYLAFKRALAASNRVVVQIDKSDTDFTCIAHMGVYFYEWPAKVDDLGIRLKFTGKDADQLPRA